MSGFRYEHVPVTEREKQIVADMVLAGKPYSEIARRIGRTKNSAIGIATRLRKAGVLPQETKRKPGKQGLKAPAGPKPLARHVHGAALAAKMAGKANVQPLPAPRVVARIEPPIGPTAGLTDIPDRNGCKWIEGDRPTWRYCGHAVREGTAYCEGHHAIMRKAAA